MSLGLVCHEAPEPVGHFYAVNMMESGDDVEILDQMMGAPLTMPCVSFWNAVNTHSVTVFRMVRDLDPDPDEQHGNEYDLLGGAPKGARPLTRRDAMGCGDAAQERHNPLAEGHEEPSREAW